MYKKSLLVLSFSAVSMVASAGNSPFKGPYVGATLSLLNTDVEYKDAGSSMDFNSDGTETGLGLNLGYGGLNGSFYGAVEAAFKTNYGKAEDSTGLVKINGKDGWELSFLPGYLINDTFLVYGRIGMGSVNTELSGPAVGSSKSEDLDLRVWGLGFQKAFTENLSANVEYTCKYFKKKTSNYEIEADSLGVALGVQYKF